MVCPRCIETVRETLVFLNVHILSIDLGEVVIDRELSGEELIQLQTKLISKGFELLEDRNAILVDKVKSTIIEHIHYNKGELKVNFSTVLSETLDQDYTKLSKLFSNAEGITIEKFINKQKIEKVKELIEYNELNLSEIAFHLNYSSLAHLSSRENWLDVKKVISDAKKERVEANKVARCENCSCSSKNSCSISSF